MADDERPQHPHDERSDVDDEHDREPSEREKLSDDGHGLSMSLVRGIPQVMWAAKRLGAQVFAICADITNANGQPTFWLCAQLEPERWRAVEVLAVSTDGTAPRVG